MKEGHLQQLFAFHSHWRTALFRLSWLWNRVQWPTAELAFLRRTWRRVPQLTEHGMTTFTEIEEQTHRRRVARTVNERIGAKGQYPSVV